MSEQEIDTAAIRLDVAQGAFGDALGQRSVLRLCAALDRARAELAATQRAKRENDERFQLEAGEQRERAEQAEAELAAVRADFEQRTAVYDRNVEWCTRKVAEVARQRDALKAAVERVRAELDRWRNPAALADPQPAVPTNPSARTTCGAGMDGDCCAVGCPQNRDGEPAATGRHCPLPGWGDEDAEPPAGKAAARERHQFVPDDKGYTCLHGLARGDVGWIACFRPADAAVHQTTTENNI